MQSEWGMKPMSAEELQKRIDDQKVIERDWKLLTKAKGLEKANINKAVACYEKFVSAEARYPLPYLRLPVIYRKAKALDDEIRVLNVAVSVFARDGDEQNLEWAQTRLKKAMLLVKKES